MFYSEIISSIFAPCLVHGFTIDLNVCPSLFWIHFSSVQVRVFVKKSYIPFSRPFILGLRAGKKVQKVSPWDFGGENVETETNLLYFVVTHTE